MRIYLCKLAVRAKDNGGIIAQVVWNADKSVVIGHAIDAGYTHIDYKHQMVLTFGKQGHYINFAALIPNGSIFKLKIKGFSPQGHLKLIELDYLLFKHPDVV